MKEKKRAAFYDLDGTLIDANIIHAYVHYALAVPKVRERLFRLTRLAFLSPSYAIAERMGRTLFNRWFYANYKDISYELLKITGWRIAKKVLAPRIFEVAQQRIKKGREMGLTQVIVSGSLDIVIEPLAQKLLIDHSITNRLEYTNGIATGKLLDPILTFEAKATAVQTFAEKHNIDLERSYAFGDSLSDLNMLEAVGFPATVNPDKKLRDIAAERNWPILKFV